jgi:hypothetical protein
MKGSGAFKLTSLICYVPCEQRSRFHYLRPEPVGIMKVAGADHNY